MSEIICQNLSVIFPVIHRPYKIKGGKKIRTNSLISINALSCINLSIKQGERVGLLGKNGAGKTTFLRSLAGVYAPSSGKLMVNGRVTSLFEANVGMDQNATGYQNIPLLMALRQIPMSKYDEVVADVEKFTELKEALGRLVRTYSRGMKLRIAFAIATFEQNNEILLMDEVMGGGDKDFKAKSKKRIENFISKAGILVLASHSSDTLKKYCTRGITFEEGKIIFDGSIEDAINYKN